MFLHSSPESALRVSQRHAHLSTSAHEAHDHTLTLSFHWMACLWGFLLMMERQNGLYAGNTWADTLRSAKPRLFVNDQEVSDGFSTEGSIWMMNTPCTKEQNLGPTAGATAVLRYPASSSLVPLFLLVSWLPPLASGPCGLRVLSVVFSVNNSRIQHSNCLWFMFDLLSLCT